MAKSYSQLVDELSGSVPELFPWDLQERLEANPDLLVVDVREPYEFAAAHIDGSITAPRGILESACDWDYEETIPALVEGREREVVVVCRSGKRSLLAAYVMQLMGFKSVASLHTGLRGWSDDDRPMVDGEGKPLDPDDAYEYFENRVREEQLDPRRRR